jgi:23S rRNA (uracil1939-C5)-methyltransferase
MEDEITEEIVQLKRGGEAIVTIVDLAFGGKGIAKVNTNGGMFVVFVPNTIPGQKVHVRITKKRKKHAEGKLIEILEHSDIETDSGFQPIAGAPFAAMPIEMQREYKEKTTLQVLNRIGKIEDPAAIMDEFICSPNTWHYRNKMEYSFAAIRYDFEKKHDVDGFGLGFKHRGTWWMVENLDGDSGLFDKGMEDGLHKVREFCEASGLPPWHAPKKEGFFRFLTVRKSYLNDQILLSLVTSSNGMDKFDFDGFVNVLKDVLGERLCGVLHTINDEISDRALVTDGTSRSLYGEEKLVEEILGLQFEISMQSFFQPNPICAALLYNKVVEYALEHDDANDDKDVVMDLFCGTGTIGQILASRNTSNSRIIGVDIIENAIDDAKANAKRNKIDGVEFYAADVKHFLKDHPQYAGKIKTIVMDPPRAGIVPKALQMVADLGAPTIVYVSCNPSTQARDLVTLAESGYVVEKFSLVDQFPHTSHIESVALLRKV